MSRSGLGGREIGGRGRGGGFGGQAAGFAFLADFGEGFGDGEFVERAAVGLEEEFGEEAAGDGGADLAADVAGGGVEPVEGEVNLAFGDDADVEVGALEVAGEVDAGDGDDAGDARVLQAAGQDGLDGVAEGALEMFFFVAHGWEGGWG